jgi:hypothetical protein
MHVTARTDAAIPQKAERVFVIGVFKTTRKYAKFSRALKMFLPVFWIAALTLIYSTLAVRNCTVFCLLLICLLSIAASVFLIFEMSTPLDGHIKVSSAPARKAIEMVGN